MNALKQCRPFSMQNQLSTRRLATSTAQRYAPAANATAIDHDLPQPARVRRIAATFELKWMIGLLGGMVGVACCIGLHTAKQQLLHSPSVHVSKKKRESVPEVDNPDAIVRSSDKFINKSFLRKIGHIQDNNIHHHDPTHPTTDSYTRSRDVETLKSVGVLH